MTDSQNNQLISATQVADYLREHQDFFIHQPALLAELRLPHKTGQAVSLVERQVSVLRERNIDMRHRLGKLLDNARDNDKLFDKTKRLTLSLLEGQDLGDIIDALFYSFDNEFKIDFTSLLLFQDRQTHDRQSISVGQAKIVRLKEARAALGKHLINHRATCGCFDAEVNNYLFGDQAPNVGSTAMVPLIYGNTFGILAIGNKDPQYYRSSIGTLFLSYIAEVLNRVLPPKLP